MSLEDMCGYGYGCSSRDVHDDENCPGRLAAQMKADIVAWLSENSKAYDSNWEIGTDIESGAVERWKAEREK